MGFFDDVDVNEVLKKSEENQEAPEDLSKSKEQIPEANTGPTENIPDTEEEVPEENIYEEKDSAPLEESEDDGALLMDELLPKEQDYIGESEAQLPGESNDVLRDSSFAEPILQETEEIKTEENDVNNKSEKIQTKKEKDSQLKQTKKMESIPRPDSGTFVCADTTIHGNVSAGAPITVYGTVKGSVTSLDKIFIFEGAKTGGLDSGSDVVIKGTVSGEVKASTVEILEEGRVLKGNIDCDDLVMSESAIVVGDIKAEKSIIIAGAVKGNVESNNKVSLKSTAIIQGNITSASIAIEDGAAIDGTCTQAYAKVKPADFFKDIKLEEDEA